MNVLVCYDVNTETAEGRRRLRRVATVCKDYGQRVQYSVFECSVNAAQLFRLRERLIQEIDLELDSLRIYTLGAERDRAVEAHGRDRWVDFTEPLIL